MSGNTALTDLNVSNNQLTNLDVSGNKALTNLNVSNNQLTNLDVSRNMALRSLNISHNKFAGAALCDLLATLPSVESPPERRIVSISGNPGLTGRIGWTTSWPSGHDVWYYIPVRPVTRNWTVSVGG